MRDAVGLARLLQNLQLPVLKGNGQGGAVIVQAAAELAGKKLVLLQVPQPLPPERELLFGIHLVQMLRVSLIALGLQLFVDPVQIQRVADEEIRKQDSQACPVRIDMRLRQDDRVGVLFTALVDVDAKQGIPLQVKSPLPVGLHAPLYLFVEGVHVQVRVVKTVDLRVTVLQYDPVRPLCSLNHEGRPQALMAAANLVRPLPENRRLKLDHRLDQDLEEERVFDMLPLLQHPSLTGARLIDVLHRAAVKPDDMVQVRPGDLPCGIAFRVQQRLQRPGAPLGFFCPRNGFPAFRLQLSGLRPWSPARGLPLTSPAEP